LSNKLCSISQSYIPRNRKDLKTPKNFFHVTFRDLKQNRFYAEIPSKTI